MEQPEETRAPWEVGQTASGKPAVYGVGKSRVSPFGTEYEAPVCLTDTFSDAHLIVNAVNSFRPTPPKDKEE